MLPKFHLWLIVNLGLLFLLATGCAGPTGLVAGKPIALSGQLSLLTGAATSNTSSAAGQIVSFQPGSRTSVTFPNGVRATNPWLLYTAVPAGARTRISIIDLRSASVLRSFFIPGTYATDGTMFDHAVLSFDGRWLALRALPASASETTIALVETTAERLVTTIRLAGDFDLDAISPDRSRIYLLQRFHDGSARYYVRLYQVEQRRLFDFPIVDKSEANEQMNGIAVARQVAADGSKVFTLYVNPTRNTAFLHILPLTGDYLGARCLDLPTAQASDLLHFYTLALRTSADGSATLYAANGALGTVVTVYVSSNDEVFMMHVDAVAHFTPTSVSSASAARTRSLYNGAALSPNGQTLFFAGMQGIWSVNTDQLVRTKPTFTDYLAHDAFTSLALSSDGATLYALQPARGILTLDARTGQAGPVLPTPGQNPRGIVWIE
jgi:hypothetical protein